MTRLVVTADAEVDITNILDHLAKEAGVAIASTYGRKFRHSIERLLEFPGLGARRPGPAPELRSFHPTF